MSKKETGGCL